MYVYNKTLGVCVMCDLCVIVHMRTANPVMEIHAFMLHSEKKKMCFTIPGSELALLWSRKAGSVVMERG